MKASEITQALQALIPTRRPAYLWSGPGCGKSALVKQAAYALGLNLIDIRAVLLDPVDLRGLPHINGGGMAHWCMPAFLPHDKQSKGVLFLDELAQASPLVQSACLQLCLDRRIAEYELPDGWTVIAASNRQEDRAGTHRLISPLLNRFVHLDLEVSADDWQAWALVNGIIPEIRSFIRYRSSLLFDFDPSTGKRAFPTPRSWEFASQVFPTLPVNLQHPVLSGTVGEGPAAEFLAHARLYKELPDPAKILQTPESSAVPTEPSIMWALVGALVEFARKAKPKELENLVTYASRMPDEFSVLLIRDTLSVQPKLLTLAASNQWLKQHRDLLLSVGK